MNFVETVEVHEVALIAVATRETVPSPVTKQLSHFVRELSTLVKDLEDDIHWISFVRRCRRTLRDLITTPIAPNRSTLDVQGTTIVLEELLARCRGGYPAEMIEAAEYCILAIGELTIDASNPLGERTCEILETGNPKNSGVLVLTRHLDATKSWLANKSPKTRLFMTAEFPEMEKLESLVILGPSCWFPSFVLGAPRAESIAVVHFDWLRDHPLERNLLAGDHASVGIEVSNAFRADAVAPLDEEDEMDAELLLPKVDWDRLAKDSAGIGKVSGDAHQYIEARLYLLAGGFGVYLEAIGESSIDSVELEGGSEPRLRRKSTLHVSRGDYVVLRSFGGSGDYIVDIADVDLGRSASQLRSLQREWKSRLGEKVEDLGLGLVEYQLKRLGIVSPNVRYRLLRQSIKSQKSDDFRILMEYIGLGDRAEKFWAAMNEIHSAHIRAGHQARSLLEAAVLDADLTQLRQTGHINVSLSEIDVGALGVFRVEDGSPTTQIVEEEDVRKLIKLEDDLWQG